MRIARIDLDGPVTAIADGDTLRPLPGVAVLDLLAASPEERARLAAAAGEPVADARLLAPLEPASVRDYSVFEQHGEGASMAIGGPDAKISPTWYEMPAFYFSNPHATTGPDEVITPPAGTTGLDLELEVAAIVCRRGRNLVRRGRGAPTSAATRSSTTGRSATSRRARRRCRSASTRRRTSPTPSAPGS